jgi:pimeloyl-ACP methyl ester carboxylesterase
VVSQHINSAPEAPSAHREGLPAPLEALMMGLLAKAPEERPASAVAVLEALSAMGAGGSGITEAQTALVTPRAKPRAAGRRRIAIGAALVAVAGAAIAAGLVFMLRDSGGGNEAAVIPVTTLVADEGYVPKLEPRVCPKELTSDPDVHCQDLVVPETRSKPAGRQIRIFVMVAPSKVKPAAIPPTVFIGGAVGTGQYFLGGGVFSQPAGLDVRNYGDVVVFGVRGRQFSQPVLACPEVPARRELLALPDNGPEANKLWLDAAQQCGQRLVSEGYDLDAYGQNEIVADVYDLAIAMGWRQINVAGRFDVARVAVLLAARYPGLVRSVVLDSPYPVDAAWYEDRLSNFSSALEAYYAACRADPACEEAFPNLEQALPALYAQAQQDPVVVTVPDPAGGPDIGMLWNGDRFVDIVTLGLTGQEVLPIIAPLLVSEDQAGSRQTAANYLVLVSGDPYGDPSGANFSAYCQDVDQRVVRGALGAAETLYPLFRVFAHDPLFELCRHWPTKARSGAIALLETASAVPALIITGGLNSYAPPAYAQRAAKAFTHATLAVFPSLTAFPSVFTAQLLANPNEPPCISALRLAFLRDPKANLDTARDGCIAKVPPITFAGTNGSGSTPAVPTSSAP